MEKQLTTETRAEILKEDNIKITILSLILGFFLFLSIHVLVVYIEIPDVFVWLFVIGGFAMCAASFLNLLIASIRYKRPLKDTINCLVAFLVNAGLCYLVYTSYRQIE